MPDLWVLFERMPSVLPKDYIASFKIKEIQLITKRLLGLDIGDRYIGIAVSDPLGLTAQPYRTYKRGTREDDLSFFGDVVEQFNVETLVCGLPLNMDGSESSQTRKAKNYAGFLKNALGLKEIKYVDERLTTLEADEILKRGGKKYKDKKKVIDTVAAQIILQEYIDANTR